MGTWGFAEFHRGYLSEFDRGGLVVDARYNRGGHVSPLLLEKLARKRVGYDVPRYGAPIPYPPESVAGPMIALTNQFAGSDGDIFSHCFKLYKLEATRWQTYLGRRHRYRPLSLACRWNAHHATRIFILVRRRWLESRELRHRSRLRRRLRASRLSRRPRPPNGYPLPYVF